MTEVTDKSAPHRQTQSAYPRYRDALPDFGEDSGPYRVHFATTAEHLRAVQRLRFAVFNLELAEGLSRSYASCRDEDAYDEHCHHLMVIERDSNAVIGTYRMQTREMAASLGFYSETEFDLGALRAEFLPAAVELGRACIAANHRNTRVLFMLWRGLAAYMLHNDKRYFFGCCSLTSRDPAIGHRLLQQLEAAGHVDRRWTVNAQPGLECAASADSCADTTAVRIPRLMRTYLQYGARIAGPPAIDHDFGTIDFLAVFDLQGISPRIRRLFLE